MEVLLQLVSVGLGGFVGSVGRWGIGLGMKQVLPDLPAGTLVANILAGLVIGFVTGLGLARPLPDRTRLFFVTGLCGGLSTFSTFSLETLQLFQAGSYALALGNICVNVVVCLAAVAAGLALGSLVRVR